MGSNFIFIFVDLILLRVTNLSGFSFTFLLTNNSVLTILRKIKLYVKYYYNILVHSLYIKITKVFECISQHTLQST